MPKSTLIEDIETYLWDKWLIVRVICEDGTIGIGEGGVHGWQFPTEAMIKTITPYLIGKDPSAIEHHYQYLYRNSHFMGSIINGALSAIDIALWDIKGKRLEVPIYDLMGGKTRNKVRCYIHVEGETIDDLISDSVEKVKEERKEYIELLISLLNDELINTNEIGDISLIKLNLLNPSIVGVKPFFCLLIFIFNDFLLPNL